MLLVELSSSFAAFRLQSLSETALSSAARFMLMMALGLSNKETVFRATYVRGDPWRLVMCSRVEETTINLTSARAISNWTHWTLDQFWWSAARAET